MPLGIPEITRDPQPSIYDVLEDGHTLYDLLDRLVDKAGFNEIETGLYHRLVDRARQLNVFGTVASQQYKDKE